MGRRQLFQKEGRGTVWLGSVSLGLSCVLVQGLLLLGYAYAIPTLWAIPSSTLERENHL